MAGLEADTSSYNQSLPVSPLEIASKVGSLQQQQQQIQSGAISIDKQKLDLMNTQFGLMNQELSTMIDDPSITKPQAAERLNRFAKTLKLPPEAVSHMMEELNAAPSVKAFSENALRRGMDTQQRINQQYGTTETQNDNATVYQGVRAPASKGGGFVPATQMAAQPAPGAEYFDEGQRRTLGPAAPEGVRRAGGLPVAAPPGAGSTSPIVPKPVRSLPVEPRVSGPTGDTIRRTDMEAGAPAGPAPGMEARKAAGFNAAPPPNFETGQKQYATDQSSATAKATALKPLEEALDLGRQLSKTGVGTPLFNDIRARATNAGLISADEKNPAVIYQMLNKSIAQYVDKNGSRSDADLALKESSNPNAKTQLQPALVHIAQKIIGRDRIEIARPGAFEGSDYSKYGKHSSEFPTSQDERAYAIDKMAPEDARQLYIEMKNNALNATGAKKEEGIRFLKSLSTAKKLRLINGIN